ncbi:hypothetical protein [Sphingobacterium anhuiense]|uniref:DUF4359 domain-containing protein n=1 Tax=Sphingobacterium anhuiense TaxID=493780 RepID=A0ABW5YY88_9SPHI
MIIQFIDSTLGKIANHALIILFSLLFMLAYDQQEKTIASTKLDEGVEILNFFLRGTYGSDPSSEASRNIDRIVEDDASYENHKLISLFTQIRERNSIDYNAVMSLKIYYDYDLNLKIVYNDGSSEVQWNNYNAMKYLKLFQYLVVGAFY